MKKTVQLLFYFLLASLVFSCSNEMNNSTLDKTIKDNGYINKEEAQKIASRFIEAQGLFPKTRSNPKLDLVYTDNDDIATRASNSTPVSYYIFNIENSGYVIVSASNVTYPVLGYSTEGIFDKTNIPINMADVLTDYKTEIKEVRKQGTQSTDEIVAMRESYLKVSPNTRASATVGPLLGSINWNQSPYYNAYCPRGCPVGCVATATCQILKYWEYPSASQGTYSYNEKTYGRLSFDYNYTLQWSNMPKYTLRSSNEDVAKLSYGVAVALNMNFSPQGSGAWQEEVPGVLSKYYKYPSTMKNVEKKTQTSNSWAAILMKELDAKRPVQYAGYGSGGGHSFVCDGYADNGYFHYNWGWGGQSNGYFMHTALNPGSLGTGGGSGGYNTGQTIVVGIQPPNTPNPDPDPNPNPDPTPTPTPDEGTEDYGYYAETKALYPRTTYIKNVSLGTINNTTKKDCGGFNYFKDKKASISPGLSYTISLTPGFLAESYKEYWKVWIDFNGDNRFESDEVIIQGTTTGHNPLTAKFTVPKNTYYQTNVRMRVSMKWGGYATPTETFKHGEVEDYNITIR